jgi:uncharacterized membrane protein
MSKLDEIRSEVESRPELRTKMVKYGAIGALLAIPLPVVGPIVGAIVGTAVAYRRRNKT